MEGKRRRDAWQSREGSVLCEKQEMGMRGSSEEESVGTGKPNEHDDNCAKCIA